MLSHPDQSVDTREASETTRGPRHVGTPFTKLAEEDRRHDDATEDRLDGILGSAVGWFWRR